MEPKQLAILSKEIKERDNFKCTDCKKPLTHADAHHIIPKIDESDNLITLCRSCHKIRHRGHDWSNAIKMYTIQLLSCGQIAKEIGVSRVAVHKFLRKNGVDTSNRKYETFCFNCNKIIYKPRCQIKSHIHNFCSQSCYFKYIKNPNYNPHRQGQRIARQVFEKEVCFTHDWVMHHEDGNNDNNVINNLWAFKTQAEHMRYHRGGKSIALKGSTRKWEDVEKESDL